MSGLPPLSLELPPQGQNVGLTLPPLSLELPLDMFELPHIGWKWGTLCLPGSAHGGYIPRLPQPLVYLGEHNLGFSNHLKLKIYREPIRELDSELPSLRLHVFVASE